MDDETRVFVSSIRVLFSGIVRPGTWSTLFDGYAVVLDLIALLTCLEVFNLVTEQVSIDVDREPIWFRLVELHVTEG